MKSSGTYLITLARVDEFKGGGGYPPEKTFYVELLGVDRHRIDLIVSRKYWPEFFEVAVKNFTVGRTIACDFLYYSTGSNALEIRLAAWHELVGAPLVLPGSIRPISEVEFFNNKKIHAFVLISDRNVVQPEPIPLGGQVQIRYYDELGEYPFPLIERGGRASGFLKWVLCSQESKQVVVSPDDTKNWFTRFLKRLTTR